MRRTRDAATCKFDAFVPAAWRECRPARLLVCWADWTVKAIRVVDGNCTGNVYQDLFFTLCPVWSGVILFQLALVAVTWCHPALLLVAGLMAWWWRLGFLILSFNLSRYAINIYLHQLTFKTHCMYDMGKSANLCLFTCTLTGDCRIMVASKWHSKGLW